MVEDDQATLLPQAKHFLEGLQHGKSALRSGSPTCTLPVICCSSFRKVAFGWELLFHSFTLSTFHTFTGLLLQLQLKWDAADDPAVNWLRVVL